VRSQFASWTVFIDAVEGQINLEKLGRKFDYQILDVRQRSGNGEWEDIPLPDWV
jgi:hypothetical protein